MAVNTAAFTKIKQELDEKSVTLVAVSKIQSVQAILALYERGQRDFGENYVQELVDKAEDLPKDIRWHFIGHLQSNKVKYIAPFVHLIQGVDSYKLLKEINKQAQKAGRTIPVLLQIHIAQEETKFGLDENELKEIMDAPPLSHVEIRGLMGMASYSDDKEQVQKEFQTLKTLFDTYKQKVPSFSVLSMGMSGDYGLAIENGSNMVRIGNLLFGARL
jgi:pyridoxal phosphate enzyme (YggS family)